MKKESKDAEPVDKAPVVTLVERNGRVKTQYMEKVTGENLKQPYLNVSKQVLA